MSETFPPCPMAGEVIEIDNEVRQCRIGEIDPPREYRLVSISQCAACPIPACHEALKQAARMFNADTHQRKLYAADELYRLARIALKLLETR